MIEVVGTSKRQVPSRLVRSLACIGCSIVLIVVLSVQLSSCVSTQGAVPAETSVKIWQDDQTTGDLVYLPLEIRFPKMVEHLARADKHVYDKKGLDVSVGYNSPDLPLFLTFYVYLRSYYPQPDTTSHFEACLGAIMKESPGSKIVSAKHVNFHFRETPVQGMMALVRYGNWPTPGQWGGYALLFPYGEYYLYMRVSFLGSDDEKVTDAVFSFMESFLMKLDLPSPEAGA